MKRPTVIIFIVVLASIFVVLLAPRVVQITQLHSRKDGLEGELTILKRKNAQLESELRLLRDDPVYLERIARRKFNKAKEGEIVYKVVRPDDRNTPVS